MTKRAKWSWIGPNVDIEPKKRKCSWHHLIYETVMTDKRDKLYLSKQMPILMKGYLKKINDLAFSSASLFLKRNENPGLWDHTDKTF